MQLLKHFKELTVRLKNVEELKGLILQLALQGKLTANWREENPDIEPASELLNRIQKEKEELIREKKLKKEKLLPEISINETSYKLPNTWHWCRLQNIIKISSGKGLTSANMDKSGKVPVYGGNGITGYHNIGNVIKPTIVIGRVGFYCGSIHLTEKNAWVTDNAFITYYSEDNISRDFLLLLLSGTNLKEDENATAQPVISGRKVYPIVVSLPPLEEQKEIVNVVETLFKEVEQLEQLTVKRITLKEDFVTSALNQLTTNNANQEWTFLQEHFKSFFNETTNIKKLRETVLQLAVQGKLTADWRANNPEVEDASILLKRIQEEKVQLIKEKKIKKEKALPKITNEEIPYKLPDGWVWCRFYEIANIASNLVQPEGYLDYPHIAPNVIEKNNGILLPFKTIREDKVISYKHLFKPGHILYSKIRPNLNKLVKVDFEGLCSADMYPIDSYIFQDYLFLFMLSKEFLRQSVKNDTRVAMPKINQTELNKVIISIPPLEEQKAIVQKVNALMGLCDALEQEIQQSQAHSEQLMQSCLREVFEGERKMEEV
ncbi:type I restriction enzyme, S subunit [Maribacter aquivivus]|uniref:Type I restriction enzyme, S subunit n=1 Tax=Maribacter aquivivus TaxID=228958 RepID=A0A1M6TT05_9FLAO|nr:restriction endonuclease subunit S [Maribacter aquivivus]SHK60132.1 type I restriction enzyme, S subunit [Maribacter aquivivus]